jgi:hypothetical protein
MKKLYYNEFNYCIRYNPVCNSIDGVDEIARIKGHYNTTISKIISRHKFVVRKFNNGKSLLLFHYYN